MATLIVHRQAANYLKKLPKVQKEKIKTSLDEAGISIPFPQQDVHLFVEKEEAAQVM